jgi:hypothetical protein
MKTTHLKTACTTAVLTFAALIAAACGHDEPEPMTPASQMEPRLSPIQAVDAITNARCDHELKCGNIAAAEDFQSRDHCLQVMRADANDELSDSDCRDGVAQRELQECLSEIANEDCGGVASVLDDVDTFISCRSGSLCLD